MVRRSFKNQLGLKMGQKGPKWGLQGETGRTAGSPDMDNQAPTQLSVVDQASVHS